MSGYSKATTKRKNSRSSQKANRSSFCLVLIPLIALLIKIITIFNTPGGGWFGADGENYAAGIDGLLADGFFSDAATLSYWPAGYPILMWPIASISIPELYYILSFIQSVFFAFATYFLAIKIRQTSISFLAIWVSLIISFNPTLSLLTLSVGYEAPVAACFMMITGHILGTLNQALDRKFWIAAASVGGWFALATFMQPRFLLIAIMIALLWAFKVIGLQNRIRIMSLVIALTMAAPITLIYRNSVAINQSVISTNLGATMKIGAGSETSGGYTRTGPEVPCEFKDSTSSDSAIVLCVLRWYATNPVDTIRLAFNKTRFFWSPWSGPEKEGTMARNPWLKISPVHQVIIGSDTGRELIYNPVGRVISHLWVIGQIFLLFFGYRYIRRLGSDQRLIADLISAPVLISWLISIATIGDHRFRIPTMTLSLILQTAAINALAKKFKPSSTKTRANERL
jgi:hypothetical protein